MNGNIIFGLNKPFYSYCCKILKSPTNNNSQKTSSLNIYVHVNIKKEKNNFHTTCEKNLIEKICILSVFFFFSVSKINYLFQML